MKQLFLFSSGPWRWFDDTMLDCCEPLAKIKTDGITFGKVACLARCNGAKVVSFRANESTIDDFRKYVVSCSSSEDCHVITSYHRGAFKQVYRSIYLHQWPYYMSSKLAVVTERGVQFCKSKPMSRSLIYYI